MLSVLPTNIKRKPWIYDGIPLDSDLDKKLLDTKYNQGDQIKENEMDGACSTHARDDKCLQSFSRIAWREETTRKT
jgi:hypothetical protein